MIQFASNEYFNYPNAWQLFPSRLAKIFHEVLNCTQKKKTAYFIILGKERNTTDAQECIFVFQPSRTFIQLTPDGASFKGGYSWIKLNTNTISFTK